MNRLFLMFSLAAGLISCQPGGHVYYKHLDLSPQVEWLKKDSREFKITIKDINIAYKMSLSFRYAEGYQYQ